MPSQLLALIAIIEIWELMVAQLIVRNLEEDLVRRLKQRAAEHGRSAEEEHRQILRASLRSEGLVERLLCMPDVGSDDDFVRPAELLRWPAWP